LKRVLIITYYWPPNGGSGVQRWLKFAKYLPEFGWQPIVFTPENPLIAQRDESLFADIASDLQVIKYPIWDPVAKLQKRSGDPNVGLLQKSKKAGWKAKLMAWLRGNLLIPDPKVFWVRPASNFLISWLKSNPVDVVVTTGPPHSMHLIGMRLQKKTGIKWVADFRDPWTSIYYFNSLYPTFLTKWFHQKLEKKVIESADCVTVASEAIALDFMKLPHRKVVKITNGFDPSDFESPISANQSRFTLSHVGNFMASQNHLPFWSILKDLTENLPHFADHLKIQLTGNVDIEIREAISTFELDQFVEYRPYIPHREVPRAMQEARILLLFINKTAKANIILTGKLFEYLASRRFVFAIGPKGGELEAILENTKSGQLIDFNDQKSIKSLFVRLFSHYLQDVPAELNNDPDMFSRRTLTQKMVHEFQSC
jgi:glycosyltransferase involved in cell wall biosynthesis